MSSTFVPSDQASSRRAMSTRALFQTTDLFPASHPPVPARAGDSASWRCCSSLGLARVCRGSSSPPSRPTRHAKPAASGRRWSAPCGSTAVALLASRCRSVFAAVYLSEYARDNWLTRLINLAIVNLAGVPSIVHALFGVGAFVYFQLRRPSVLAAGCTLAVMTLPVVIVATRESLQAVPHSLPRGLLEHGRDALADHPHDRGPAELGQRHPDRRHPRGVAHRRRDRPDHVHRRGVPSCLVPAGERSTTSTMAMSATTSSSSRPR